MKEKIKKLPKKTIAIMLVLAMVLHYFLPLGEVFADNTSYTLTFTIGNNVQNEHTMQNDNGNLKIDGQYVELKKSDNREIRIGTVSCNDANTTCTITVTDGTPGKLEFFGNQKFSLFVSGHEVSLDQVITNNENYAVQDYVEPPQQQEPPQGGESGGEPHFDGKAYLIWSCSNGGICFKHFDNIPNFDDGNSTFYKASEIEDARTHETFNINAEYKGWATDANFDNWVNAYKKYKNIEGNINWATVDPKDMIGDPIDMGRYENDAIAKHGCTREVPEDEFHACVDDYVAGLGLWGTRAQLQPLNEPQVPNAYVSYGDRNFKVVVYNEEYKGVSIGSLEDLHYYPAAWANMFIKRDQYDVSNTTKSNPAVIDTVLLESTVNIKPLSDVNGYNITKIEALDVPDGAVTINKVDGEWKLVFSSNFYDNVVFKVTDSNGKTQYIKIKRTTIDAWIIHEGGHPVLNADFYFDNTKSYTDFDITAKIIRKDGTERNIELKAKFGIDDGLGNITEAYEVDEEKPILKDVPTGKGLKKATFQAALTDNEDERDVKDIFIYIEFKGSTATNYAGSYAGSGEGVPANLHHEEGEE